MASTTEIHAQLSHPVIDIDGHMAEHLPTLAPYLEHEGLSLDHPSLRRLIPPYGGSDQTWHSQTPTERSSSTLRTIGTGGAPVEPSTAPMPRPLPAWPTG